MKKWKAIVALCLVFFFGMLAGGLVAFGVVHRHVRQVLQGGPDAVAEMIVHRLDRDLRLDPSQREQLRGIVDATRVELKSVRREVQPRLDDLLSAAEKHVRAILKPEQTSRFDALVKKGRAHWQHVD